MWRTFIVGLAVVCLLLVAGNGLAVTKDWNDGSDNWSNAADWTPAGVPGAGDSVNIVFADNVARTVTYDYTGPAVTLGPLAIDMAVPGVNVSTLTMPGSALSVSGGEVIGDLGGANFNQNGGTHTISGVELVVGNAASGIGTYNLSGTGTLAATTNEVVGNLGRGDFNQSGGTNTISGAGHHLVVGQGIASAGTYTLSGGTLSVGENENVGVAGIGGIQHDSGSNTVGGTLTVGVNSGGTGVYNFNTGTLLATNETIGAAGAGTFTQNGGVHTVAQTLRLGGLANGGGTFNLVNPGQLAVNDKLIVGDLGSGNFGQTGGAVTVNGTGGL